MKLLAFWVAKSGKPAIVSTVEYSLSSALGISFEHYDIASYEGEKLAERYGVRNTPAIVALNNYGTVINIWYGSSAPSKDELQYYLDRNM